MSEDKLDQILETVIGLAQRVEKLEQTDPDSKSKSKLDDESEVLKNKGVSNPQIVKPRVKELPNGKYQLTFEFDPKHVGKPYHNRSGRVNTYLFFGDYSSKSDNRVPLMKGPTDGQTIFFDMKLGHTKSAAFK